MPAYDALKWERGWIGLIAKMAGWVTYVRTYVRLHQSRGKERKGKKGKDFKIGLDWIGHEGGIRI